MFINNSKSGPNRLGKATLSLYNGSTYAHNSRAPQRHCTRKCLRTKISKERKRERKGASWLAWKKSPKCRNTLGSLIIAKSLEVLSLGECIESVLMDGIVLTMVCECVISAFHSEILESMFSIDFIHAERLVNCGLITSTGCVYSLCHRKNKSGNYATEIE